MVRQAWRFDEELSHAAWLRVLRGHRPPSVQWPKAGQQQERQSDWLAKECRTMAAAAQASPGRSSPGSSSGTEFQASRAARCCRTSEDSTVGGSPRSSWQFHWARSRCAPASVEEGTYRRRGSACDNAVEAMSNVCREEREEDCLYRPRTGSRDEVARGRQGPFAATQEGGRNSAARATDCATDFNKHPWRGPEVAGNGGATSIREGRVVEEEGQSTVARRFRVCFRRGSDPMVGRSPERYERRIDDGERWGSGQDGRSRERGHQSVEAVDWAIWCRREWHVSFHGGEHRPVSQKLRLVFHRCGFLGCRVGEASNPGPVQTRQARRAEHDRLTARGQTAKHKLRFLRTKKNQ